MENRREQSDRSRTNLPGRPSGIRERSVGGKSLDWVRSKVALLGLVAAPVVTVAVPAALSASGCGLDVTGTCENCEGGDAGGDVANDVFVENDAHFPSDASDAKPDGVADAGSDVTDAMVDAPEDADAAADADASTDAATDALVDGDAADADVVDAADADSDADAADADPCASALSGFTITVKGLPNNRYDWDLFRAGASIKDSFADGVDETTDNVITDVKYDDVLVVQSKPDVPGAPEVEKYATQNVVALPAGCIDETVLKKGGLLFATMSDVDFQAINDTCSTCTSISNDSVSPNFHYQYKNPSPSYQSTVYRITFKKP